MKYFRREGSLLSEPSVTLTVICPSCGGTLLFGAQNCRFCREPIDEEYAKRNALYRAIITQAISLANIIRTGKPVIPLLIVVGIAAYLIGMKWLYTVAGFPAAVFYCAAAIRWRYRYGDVVLTDEEFTRTQREMKNYLHLWLGFVAAQIIVMTMW